jgi:Asp-tRNA(Asn)/Glu-tRNA(Gln) amidotransferase A subunit family amidase
MAYTFQDAIAEVLAQTMPEYFWRTTNSGELEFAVPGWDVRSVNYATALSLRKAPLSDKINLRTITNGLSNPGSLLAWNRYLMERGDTRVKDWASWAANATFKTEEEMVRGMNAAMVTDVRPSTGSTSYMQMQAVTRMIIMKVMYENKIDVFVNPEQTTSPYLLGGALEPEVNGRGTQSCCQRFTALLGSPEADVPAGYVTTTYDPKYVLTPDKMDYMAVTGDVQSKLPYPMPISLMFWGGPGTDSDVIKAASAYEAATHHRVPPPMFGPLKTLPESSAK